MTFSLYNNHELHNEKGRLYFYDNAKFILIFFVVLAHYLSPLTVQFPFCRTLWYTINTFHMPAFIFISGFFAKSYISADRTIKVQRTATYIILFLFSQIAVSTFEWFVLHKSFPFSLVYARSSLWFLQCLILWHLALPFVARFKAWIAIPVAIGMALYIGYEKDCTNFMALSRVFVHFPFFLCGYYCTQKTLDRLFSWKARLPLLLAAGGIIYLYVYFGSKGFGKLLTCNYSYAQIPFLQDVPEGWRWVARLCFYAAAMLLGAAFLSLIPRGRVAYTSLGAKSLSVYICHRFVYLAELEYGWATAYFASAWGIAAVAGIALVMTILFSVKPFTVPFDLLQKIPVKALLRDGKQTTEAPKKV